MGNLAIRIQALGRELMWDGEKMDITSISPEEKIRLITSHQYKKVNKQQKFNTSF